jgi:hypothetical protein
MNKVLQGSGGDADTLSTEVLFLGPLDPELWFIYEHDMTNHNES